MGIPEIQQAQPYLWEIASFFGVLGVLRITQWIKQVRSFPLWICNVKFSRDGNHQYKKLKKKYLIAIATLGSFAVIVLCLLQRYENINQVLIIAGIAAVSQDPIIKLIFSQVEKRVEGASDVLSNGLYVQEEDHTVLTKAATLIVGGGVNKRNGDR